MDLQQHFCYDDTLLTVMQFVVDHTEISDFVLESMYPPLRIDSAYLDPHRAAQIEADEDGRSGSVYERVQRQLGSTLEELQLVPSCRMFVNPKFRGNLRRISARGDGGVAVQAMTALLAFLRMALHFGVDTLWTMGSVLWMVMSVPFEWMGIVQGNGHRKERTPRQEGKEKVQRPQSGRGHSKLSRCNKRDLKRSTIRGLSHYEKKEDRNTLNNGNSTMYGGDGQ